jgi:hypothetical protein
MADTLMQEAILHGDLIVSVDDTLAGYDARKLPAALRSALSAALADARGLNSALQLAAGDQAGARLRVKTGHERLSGLVRNSHSHINSIPDREDGDAPVAEPEEKLDALVSLGFESGELGQLQDRTHLLQIVDAIIANNGALPVVLRVPAATVSRLTNWRAVMAANQNIADGGTREELTQQKDDARDVLERRLARVRLYIASCTDEGEKDAALARYGFQPKRDPGDAQPQPKPEAPGTFTWDAPTRTGSVPALPLHATRIVAWRQIAGGEAEPCGVSETTEVNFAETAPFIPGGAYTLWVTGRNSAGDGPPSNTVAWTAPV